VPDEHYYRLAADAPPVHPAGPGSRPGAPGRLLFAGFTLAPALAGDRILASIGPVRLEPYANHRWIGPLDALLNEAAFRHLTASGRFALVLGPGERTGSDRILRGHVTEFFERDAGERWFADVALDVELIASESGEVLWRKEFRESVPAEQRHPESVVHALSRALAVVMSRVADGAAGAP
jgi:ABC-type uncharacterized transport system auxiliary subunit